MPNPAYTIVATGPRFTPDKRPKRKHGAQAHAKAWATPKVMSNVTLTFSGNASPTDRDAWFRRQSRGRVK